MSILTKLTSLFQPSQNPAGVLARYFPTIKPVFLTRTCEDYTHVTGRGCIMNVISYMEGDTEITGRPNSVHETMHGFGQVLNDFTNDDNERQKLVKYIPRFMLTNLWSPREVQVAAYELYNFLNGLRQEFVSEEDLAHPLHVACSMYHYVALGETSYRSLYLASHTYMAFFDVFATVLPQKVLGELEATLDRVLPKIEPGLVEGVVRRYQANNALEQV